ncbi:MAG: F0F1 ATP synthase subunit epsilon [Candidatus Tectomicrobia bacterium]|uniref:ATP synthase epsilon chain n=1 Tax=Tectimicrobiota bacterium TaxID=2528274 RepID=A0A932M294_UNCTE|nr:F0F1 ATP synthase subunit epsilon [Candidatus Tectomicrobia bacterium]
MAEILSLQIVTPDRLVVEERVDEVTAPGTLGEFGVLPGHTPFLSSLGIGEVCYRKGSERHYLSIAWGYAEVEPESVTILAEIAEKAEEIDRERAEAARRRAEKRLAGGEDTVDFERAQVALQKALIRLQVISKKLPG